jgi:aromatase
MARSFDGKAEHDGAVRASAPAVYRLLADLENWPRMFKPFVHLEPLSADGDLERIGMWTTRAEVVDHWVVRRRLDPDRLRLEFRPEIVQPPLESMERHWTVTPLSDDKCLARLTHDYRVATDEPAALEAVREQIDQIADAELAAVRAMAELEASTPDLCLVLRDTVDIDGSPEAVYDFLYEAGHWPDRMPHVASVDLPHDAPRTQVVKMETLEAGGGRLTTKTARVGFPHRLIAYKHLLLPPIGKSHCVRLWIGGTPRGATVTCLQDVVLTESGVAELLGDGARLSAARDFARGELTSKMRLLLDNAKRHVESRPF